MKWTRVIVMRCVLGSAIVFGLLWNVLPWLRDLRGDSSIEEKTHVRIWVADRYIPAGTPIPQKYLRAIAWPRRFISPGTLMLDEKLIDSWDRPRFSAAVAIPEGQPITRTLVLDAQNGETIGQLLRPGQVAVSFQVERAKGAGGWVQPGDMIAVFSDKPTSGLRLIVPSITVLAVDGKRLSPEPEKPQDPEPVDEIPHAIPSSLVITVRANPLEASALISASENGSVHVVVRSPGDELPWTAVN